MRTGDRPLFKPTFLYSMYQNSSDFVNLAIKHSLATPFPQPLPPTEVMSAPRTPCSKQPLILTGTPPVLVLPVEVL